jgi:hypothetical protein
MTSTLRADDPLTAERIRIRTLPWRKSTRSGGANNDCVALAVDGNSLLVRDTKEDWAGGIILRLPIDELHALKRTLSS